MFKFAVVGLNHCHIYSMVEHLEQTERAELKSVYAEEEDLLAQFKSAFPKVKVASSKEEILNDPEIKLVCSTAINNQRGSLAVEVLQAGKSIFVDKPPVTKLSDVDAIKEAVKTCSGSYYVYWCEKAHAKSQIKMKQMIEEGMLGKIVHFMGLGPHKLEKCARPSWMFSKESYGGILIDLACHQLDVFTWFTGQDIVQHNSRVANLANRDTPDFDDFGDVMFVGSKGATGYARVDWFTPEAFPVFGDVRQMVVGTEGYMESRTCIDIGKNESEAVGNRLYFASKDKKPIEIDLSGVDDKGFFLDIVDGIEKGNRGIESHAGTFKLFTAMVQIQNQAEKIESIAE